jgi:hypothetical protein
VRDTQQLIAVIDHLHRIAGGGFATIHNVA